MQTQIQKRKYVEIGVIAVLLITGFAGLVYATVDTEVAREDSQEVDGPVDFPSIQSELGVDVESPEEIVEEVEEKPEKEYIVLQKEQLSQGQSFPEESYPGEDVRPYGSSNFNLSFPYTGAEPQLKIDHHDTLEYTGVEEYEFEYKGLQGWITKRVFPYGENGGYRVPSSFQTPYFDASVPEVFQSQVHMLSPSGDLMYLIPIYQSESVITVRFNRPAPQSMNEIRQFLYFITGSVRHFEFPNTLYLAEDEGLESTMLYANKTWYDIERLENWDSSGSQLGYGSMRLSYNPKPITQISPNQRPYGVKQRQEGFSNQRNTYFTMEEPEGTSLYIANDFYQTPPNQLSTTKYTLLPPHTTIRSISGDQRYLILESRSCWECADEDPEILLMHLDDVRPTYRSIGKAQEVDFGEDENSIFTYRSEETGEVIEEAY
jgi:hypothetical protein